MNVTARVRPVLLALALAACSRDDAPPTSRVPDPAPAPAPAGDGVEPPAQRPNPVAGLREASAGDDVPPAEKAYRLQMRQARSLADRAVTTHLEAHRREAVEAYLTAAALRPDDPIPLAEAGMLAHETGDPPTAVRLLQRCREIAPDHGATWFFQGTFTHRYEDYEAAVQAFEKAAERDYRREDAGARLFNSLWSLGIRQLDLSRNDEALNTLSRAVELRPDHPKVSSAWYDVATAHRRLNQPREAEKILRDLIKRFPSYAPAYGELGAILAEEDRHEEALEYFEKSVRVDPGYSQGVMLLATALTRKGRLEEAARYFDLYEAQFPPSGQSHMERGRFWLESKEPEKALDWFRSALALDPSLFRAHYYMAQAWRLLGDDAEVRAAEERYRVAENAVRMAQEAHERKMDERTGAGSGTGE